MKSSKLNLYLIAAVLVCSTAFSGCFFEQESRAYDGPPVAAFKFQDAQVAAGAGEINLEVQVIRPTEGLLDEPLPINFIVVGEETTAISSDDYTIVTPSPVTIPANSLKTNLTIDVNGDAIPEGEARVLTLQLTGNEERGIKGAVEFGRFELLIVGN